jgi:hypothetical protein
MKIPTIYKAACIACTALTTSSFIHLGAKTDYAKEPSNTQEPALANKSTSQWEYELQAEALLWIAQQSGLSYAVKSSQAATSSSPLGKGTIYSPNFDWDVGFRAGAGFRSLHNHFDTLISYSWFHDKAKSSVEQGSQSIVRPELASSILSTSQGMVEPAAVAKASSLLNLYLDIIDWDLGREFIPSHWFSIRPVLGIKAAWIHQKNDTKYQGFYLLSNSADTSNIDVARKNNYWGIGPKAGMTTHFWLGRGFSIFGAAAISGVYGKFSLHHNEDSTKQGVVVDTANSYYSGRAITDLTLSLRWDSLFCKIKKASRCRCPKEPKRVNVAVAAGWEEHIFFSQGQFMRFNDPSNPAGFTQQESDLTVQGATLSLHVDF